MKCPAPVISVQDGDIVVDAEFLAAKLGLSTDSLREEMRRGLVYSVTERGIDEDEGCTRLTFRYRARSWTVVVKPDRSLNDASASASLDNTGLIDSEKRTSGPLPRTMPNFERGRSDTHACKGARIPRERRGAPTPHYLTEAGEGS
jgi:hypothetical protein